MRLGVQLRPWLIQEPQPTVEAALSEAVQAGFNHVEIGAHYLDWDHPEMLRQSIQACGVSISGVHVGGDIFNPDHVKFVRSQLGRVLSCLTDLDVHNLLFSGLLIEHKTAEELQSELKAITQAAEMCKHYGIRLLYHHHWWEIADDYRDLRFYLAETNPQMVSFCLDIGWIFRAGGDPLKAINLCADRATYFHLRDDTLDHRWVGLGEGVIDYHSLLRGTMARHADWIVLEQDDITGSVTDALRASRV